MRRLAALLVLLVGPAGCLRNLRGEPPAAEFGTCEGACEHYTECRGGGDPALLDGCVAECRTIFETDGEVDGGSLREFEDLECGDAIAFVEGAGGRRPGAAARAEAP